ncbi:hypothetical protein ACFYY5_29295 [Nocardia elegans]|uniref:DUF7448 domain-containing protein n=1 Tax=Nocardia elegans TaxID=300029 RepID=A0ABW6TLH9_9NOCA
MTNEYPEDTVGEDDDNGTMPANVEQLAEHVIGHRIVSAANEDFKRETYWGASSGLVLTLDNGTRVCLADTDDCCAYTSLQSFLLHPEQVDHVITGVATTGGYTKWHIFADFGDVLELEVGWSCGNPFYYGYGFDIFVVEEPGTSEVAAA